MKYISYFFMAIANTLLVMLLSLSSCSPNPKATTSQPMAMKDQPKEQPQANTSQAAQSQSSQQTAPATVKIRNFKFEPANLAIAVGKTVQFINVDEEPHTATPFSFVQISDTHIGFHKPANEHVTDTLQKTIDAINALPTPPAFVIHTGDISQMGMGN